MTFERRVLVAFAAAVAAGVAATVAIFIAAAFLGDCPPAPRVCDAPGMAAAAYALLGAPVVALVAGLLAFRRAGRRAAGSGKRPG